MFLTPASGHSFSISPTTMTSSNDPITGSLVIEQEHPRGRSLFQGRCGECRRLDRTPDCPRSIRKGPFRVVVGRVSGSQRFDDFRNRGSGALVADRKAIAGLQRPPQLGQQRGEPAERRRGGSLGAERHEPARDCQRGLCRVASRVVGPDRDELLQADGITQITLFTQSTIECADARRRRRRVDDSKVRRSKHRDQRFPGETAFDRVEQQVDRRRGWFGGERQGVRRVVFDPGSAERRRGEIKIRKRTLVNDRGRHEIAERQKDLSGSGIARSLRERTGGQPRSIPLRDRAG